MAKKRMFSLDVIDTDRFMEMGVSARELYFQLGLRGDDDGFIGNPKRIMRNIGASVDDMNVLIAKGFVYAFQSGIVVITDWNLNNTLKNDRYKETIYLNEKKQLQLENKRYVPITQDFGKPVETKDSRNGNENRYLGNTLETNDFQNGSKVKNEKTNFFDDEMSLFAEKRTSSYDFQNGSNVEPQLNLTKHNYSNSSSTNEVANQKSFAFREAIALFESIWGYVSPFIEEEIQADINEYGEELVEEAMKRAALGKKTYRYAQGAMRSWQSKNIKTKKQIMAADVEFQNDHSNRQSIVHKKVTKNLPEWTDEYKLNSEGVDTSGMTQNEMYRLAEDKGLHDTQKGTDELKTVEE